jgi:tetratricopeptide (TPR) repeat protein
MLPVHEDPAVAPAQQDERLPLPADLFPDGGLRPPVEPVPGEPSATPAPEKKGTTPEKKPEEADEAKPARQVADVRKNLPPTEDIYQVVFGKDEKGEAKPVPTPAPQPAGKASVGEDRTPGGHLSRAAAFLKAQDLENALAQYTAALKLEPDSVEGLLGRAECRVAQKNYDAALADYDAALDVEPANQKAHLEKASCLARMGRAAQALEICKKVTRQDEKSAEPWLLIGKIYYDQGTAEGKAEAEKSYRSALKADPQSKKAYNNLGVILMERKKIDDAQKAFESAIALDKNFADPYLNLGILYEEERQNKILALKNYLDYVDLGGSKSDEVRKWIEDLKKE